MLVATWNVNSIRTRLDHITNWVNENKLDLLLLQETKVQDSQFPLSAIEEIGYGAIFNGQKSYNGVATLYKNDDKNQPKLITSTFSTFEDEQQRLQVILYNDIYFFNVYIPNGKDINNPAFEYKLSWLDALISEVKAIIEQNKSVAILGDYNIAPDSIDVHNEQRWENSILTCKAVRDKFKEMESLQLIDVFRAKHPEANEFTWWDYRLAAFQRGWGLRIDHILASQALYDRTTTVWHDKDERSKEKPSDHIPVCWLID